MALKLVAVLGDDLILAPLYLRVDELDNFSGIHADHMIMVIARGNLEDGMTAIKIVPLHDAGGLKLREHTVDCGQPNVFPGTNKRFVHVFGTHMLFVGFLEDLEDPQPRQRCFQAGFLEVGSFQFGQTFRLISHVMNSSDGLLIGYTASPLAVCFRV